MILLGMPVCTPMAGLISDDSLAWTESVKSDANVDAEVFNGVVSEKGVECAARAPRGGIVQWGFWVTPGVGTRGRRQGCTPLLLATWGSTLARC